MAREISGLLVRHYREGLVAGTGESAEIDFNIPRGLAIGIWGIDGMVVCGDNVDAAEIDALVDLDGPGLASNALSTVALVEARQILESCIFSIVYQQNLTTSGAKKSFAYKTLWYPDPIFTARNLGAAGVSQTSAAEIFFAIYYKWYQIAEAEQLQLFIDQRS